MDSLKSSNEIPTRTSSAGFASSRKTSTAVLRPLPEDNWLSSSKSSNSGDSMPQTGALDDQSAIRQHRHNSSIGDNLIRQESASWSQGKETILFGPYEYLFGNPGKDIRSQLVAAFNAWLNVPTESLDIITKVVGMLHTASLL